MTKRSTDTQDDLVLKKPRHETEHSFLREKELLALNDCIEHILSFAFTDAQELLNLKLTCQQFNNLLTTGDHKQIMVMRNLLECMWNFRECETHCQTYMTSDEVVIEDWEDNESSDEEKDGDEGEEPNERGVLNGLSLSRFSHRTGSSYRVVIKTQEEDLMNPLKAFSSINAIDDMRKVYNFFTTLAELNFAIHDADIEWLSETNVPIDVFMFHWDPATEINHENLIQVFCVNKLVASEKYTYMESVDKVDGEEWTKFLSHYMLPYELNKYRNDELDVDELSDTEREELDNYQRVWNNLHDLVQDKLYYVVFGSAGLDDKFNISTRPVALFGRATLGDRIVGLCSNAVQT